jgi:acetyl-CoA C-acetyltransferase
VTREAQDRYAVESHRRAAAATRAGLFRDEILPVHVPQPGGTSVVIDRDESIREDTNLDALARLAPAFMTNGTVTAGNAPSVNDAAAALVVTGSEVAAGLGLRPLARIVGYATSGLEPKLVMMTPVDAVRTLLPRIGWTLAEVHLVELNEAFAVQAVAVTRELGLDPSRVNVHGGAVALGHPIGASGARILTTLIYALRHRGETRGIATLCLGGGNGVAMAIEIV